MNKQVTLSQVPAQEAALHTGRAVCPYCGVGCVIEAQVRDNRILAVEAPVNTQPNEGMMCPKGALIGRVFDVSARLDQPLIRVTRSHPLQPVSWPLAFEFIAGRIRGVQESNGGEGMAFYGSGQLDTEASYLFTKLFKGCLGTNHMDSNSRLCMSSAVSGYVNALGSDGPPVCYDDINHANVFLAVGANMASNHPVLFNMVRRRCVQNSDARLIVLDPRRTRTADLADVHVPLAPGSDVAFLQLLAKRLLDRDCLDHTFVERHTSGFDAWRDQLNSLIESELLATCNVEPTIVDQVLDTLTGEDLRLLSFYCMGTNQSTRGVDKNLALINLHLQLGQIAQPGAGPFSLTGQPNAMGGREMGYLAHQLPGYRFVSNPEHRREVARIWNLPDEAISTEPGYSATEMFREAAEGRIKGLWIAATNPAVSMPDLNITRQGLKRAELVIVQDCYKSCETLEYADAVLPAAQWGEKRGTMTNSERLVVRSERFLDPPGQARPDWSIAVGVGRALGFKEMAFNSIEEIWDEIRLITRGRPCDMYGMTNDRLAEHPLHWPCPETDHPGTRRRFLGRRFDTADGRACFHTTDAGLGAESPCEQYPFVLTTGRIATQWHTRTRTALVPELNRQDPNPFIEIHPDDAAGYHLEQGQRVTLESRRGRTTSPIRITARIQPGLLFMPFHWGDAFSPDTSVNRATHDAIDPRSKQPELKYCAVRIQTPPTNQHAFRKMTVSDRSMEPESH